MKKRYVPICPKCGSTNIINVYLASPAELSKFGIIGAPPSPSVFICKKCGYYGICPEIEEDKILDFREKLKRKK